MDGSGLKMTILWHLLLVHYPLMSIGFLLGALHWRLAVLATPVQGYIHHKSQPYEDFYVIWGFTIDFTNRHRDVYVI